VLIERIKSIKSIVFGDKDMLKENCSNSSIIIIYSTFDDLPKLYQVEDGSPSYYLALQADQLIINRNDEDYPEDVVDFFYFLDEKTEGVTELSKTCYFSSVRLVNVAIAP
jgi:hypothetical protein